MLKYILNFIFLIRKKHNFVFFSESKNYQKYLIDFINAIASSKIEIIYLSSDKNDKIFLSNVKNIYVGNKLTRFFYLSFIKSKYFFMTLTDLDNHEIKKTNKVEKYIYIFHAANSVHRAYTVSAFNNYDIILCPGPQFEIEIRKLEKLYSLKNKEIIKSGYFYLDKLQKFKHKKNSDPKTVLIAPSWNYNKKNFLLIYSESLIKKLLSFNYKIIFRPHSEHFARNKNFIEMLFSKYNKIENFKIDIKESNLDSMLNSRYLITDYSGIAIEYILGLNKPVVYFDKYPKIHNKYFKDIQENTIEDDIKKLFGISVHNPNLENIRDYLNMSEKKVSKNLKSIETYTKKNFFNINKSVQFTANFFLNR